MMTHFLGGVAAVLAGLLSSPMGIATNSDSTPVLVSKAYLVPDIILLPLPEEEPLSSCEAPTDTEIIAAIASVHRDGSPLMQESSGDISIVKKRCIKNQIEEPRFYPTLGLLQAHRCRWECTVHSTRIVEASWPVPVRIQTGLPSAEVVYIDKNHFHRVASTDSEVQKAKTEPAFGASFAHYISSTHDGQTLIVHDPLPADADGSFTMPWYGKLPLADRLLGIHDGSSWWPELILLVKAEVVKASGKQ